MKIMRIKKDLYANIDHISEIGLDHRTNDRWFIKILGDDELFYVSEEEAMEIIKVINTVSELQMIEQLKNYDDTIRKNMRT